MAVELDWNKKSEFKDIQNEKGIALSLFVLLLSYNVRTKHTTYFFIYFDFLILIFVYFSSTGILTASSKDLGSAVLRQTSGMNSLSICDKQMKHF